MFYRNRIGKSKSQSFLKSENEILNEIVSRQRKKILILARLISKEGYMNFYWAINRHLKIWILKGSLKLSILDSYKKDIL